MPEEVVRLKSSNVGPVISTPVTGSEKVTVKSTLARFVGLGLTRVMESTVGGVTSEGVPLPFSEMLFGEEAALLGMEGRFDFPFVEMTR